MGTDPRLEVARLLARVHRDVAVALWLSAGMVLATAMLLLTALGWRRCALLAGAGYAAALCFVPVGPAEILGPFGLAAAAAGLLLRGSRR